YEEAAGLLRQKLIPGRGLLLPYLNVSMVAIELYLKSLSSSSVYIPHEDGVSTVYAKADVHGHELRKIYAAIPEDVRDGLEAAFALTGSGAGQSFEESLKSYDNLFAACRYPFEPSLSVGGIALDRLEG